MSRVVYLVFMQRACISVFSAPNNNRVWWHGCGCVRRNGYTVQWLLNCGPKPTNHSSTDATEEQQQQPPHHLTSHGGSALFAYDYIYNTLQYVPEESCLPYLACSEDSNEGFCPHVRDTTVCTVDNPCRRSSKPCIPQEQQQQQQQQKQQQHHHHDSIDDDRGSMGGGGDASDPMDGTKQTKGVVSGGGNARDEDCQNDDNDTILPPPPLPGSIPNVTIAEYGTIEAGNIHAIQAEIYAR